MNAKKTKKTLLAIALGLAVLGAVLGGTERRVRAKSTIAPTIGTVAPMEVAAMLAAGRPTEVVLTLGTAKHPLEGAWPASADGASDDAIVAGAPSARAIVLAGADPVRVDRVARALAATGRRVRVLAGGLEAWDRAMDEDPPAPEASALGETWSTYRTNVALRRRFGDASARPAAVIAAPPAPTNAAGGAPRKREGC